MQILAKNVPPICRVEQLVLGLLLDSSYDARGNAG